MGLRRCKTTELGDCTLQENRGRAQRVKRIRLLPSRRSSRRCCPRLSRSVPCIPCHGNSPLPVPPPLLLPQLEVCTRSRTVRCSGWLWLGWWSRLGQIEQRWMDDSALVRNNVGTCRRSVWLWLWYRLWLGQVAHSTVAVVVQARQSRRSAAARRRRPVTGAGRFATAVMYSSWLTMSARSAIYRCRPRRRKLSTATSLERRSWRRA